MAYAKNIYHVKADLSVSPFIDRAQSQIATPAGYEEKVPDLVVAQSFSLVLECYDDHSADSRSTFDGTTAAMVLKLRNSTEAGITLVDSVAVATNGTDSEYNTFNLACPKDTITDFYDGKECILQITITGTSGKNILLQELGVISADGTGDADFDSADITASTAKIAAVTSAPDANLDTADGYSVGDYVYHIGGTQTYRCDNASAGAAIWVAVDEIDAYKGHVSYLLDTTAGALVVEIPLAAAKTVQDISLSKTDDTNTATISATVNGEVNPILYGKQAVDLWSDGAAWYSPRWDKFI